MCVPARPPFQTGYQMGSVVAQDNHDYGSVALATFLGSSAASEDGTLGQTGGKPADRKCLAATQTLHSSTELVSPRFHGYCDGSADARVHHGCCRCASVAKRNWKCSSGSKPGSGCVRQDSGGHRAAEEAIRGELESSRGEVGAAAVAGGATRSVQGPAW